MIHIKDEVSTCRVYKEGESYENRDTAIFTCTVHYIRDDTVYICNAQGTMSIAIIRSIREYAKSVGVTNITYERYSESRSLNV